MRRSTRVRLTLLLTLAAWAMLVPAANAYIDPASTSVVFQAILAGLAAAGTGVAMFWSRIKSLFSRSGGSPTQGDDEHERV